MVSEPDEREKINFTIYHLCTATHLLACPLRQEGPVTRGANAWVPADLQNSLTSATL